MNGSIRTTVSRLASSRRRRPAPRPRSRRRCRSSSRARARARGADFGGLAGADKHCQTLAAAAGAGAKKWHAYLSTQAAGSTPAVNAKDRIGKGPWQNAKGVVIAKDVADLHGGNNLTKQTALTEKGGVVTAAATRRTSTTS